MARGMVPGLISPHPLGPTLPGLYQDEDFTQRFVGAFDDVLAPVIATLDNLHAYLDPQLAPVDFLEWLASWVGLELDESWSEARQRALVARAVELYGRQGTVTGLRALVRIYTGVDAEIEESGGVSWSSTPASDPPGSSEPHLTVRVVQDPKNPVDVGRLDALVTAAKPAHLPHTVEVLA
ncbi:MAG: phage tail protein I [Streptosporangiales bacterium]|nr:phage tail protein I [Streptosporangiales bacterium]